MGAEKRVFLVGRRRVAVAPQQDVIGEIGEFGPQIGVDDITGAGDREVETISQPRPARQPAASAASATMRPASSRAATHGAARCRWKLS